MRVIDDGLARRLKRSIFCRDLVQRCGVELKRHGSQFVGLCPFHKETTPSFDVTETGFKCFGCGATGDHVKFLQMFYKTGFKDAVRRLDDICGGGCLPGSQYAADETIALDRELKKARAIERARTIWERAVNADNSPVRSYLHGRGIECPIPRSIRFHPRLWNAEVSAMIPAMVGCIIGADGTVCGVHRTYLQPDGRGGWQKLGVEKPKKILGEMMGGHISLLPMGYGEALAIGEGIETCLSVVDAMPRIGVWSALSLANLSSVRIPDDVRHVIILADNDSNDTAQRDVDRIIRRTADEWRKAGRMVTIAQPRRGQDWNDAWRERQSEVIPRLIMDNPGVPVRTLRAGLGLI